MRRALALPLLTSSLVGLATFARADPPAFPRYDVEGRCRTYAQKGGNYGLCLDGEQRAYDFAQLLWDNLTDEQKIKCADFVYKPDPMRYTALRECVSLYSHMNDLQRRQSTERFRY